MLNGQTLAVTDEEGKPVVDNSFLLIVNAAQDGVEFTLPPCTPEGRWVQIIDTEDIYEPFSEKLPAERVIVGGRSLKLFKDIQIGQTETF